MKRTHEKNKIKWEREGCNYCVHANYTDIFYAQNIFIFIFYAYNM